MKHYGKDRALEICTEREAEMARAQDVQGMAAWCAITSAIEELDRKPKPGERMN
jgi:hypothetical protein